MDAPAVVVAVVSFALVAGYAGLYWLRRGRDPSFGDDSSILMAAPPPAMTAATAVIVDGGPGRRAFMAGLLDLASRDEIAFREESYWTYYGYVPGGLGIAIRGGDSQDPQVLLNRRRPVGEGEAWLLNSLRTTAASTGGAHLIYYVPDGESPNPRDVELGREWVSGLLQTFGYAEGEYDSPEAVAARKHGLLSANPDGEALAADAMRATGHTVPDASSSTISRLTFDLETGAHLDAIARDPEAFARDLEARTGKTLTADQRARIQSIAKEYAGVAKVGPLPTYIPAVRTVTLRAGLLFGPLVERYATRHGWLAGLPVLRRLRWWLTGGAEVMAGGLFAYVGSGAGSNEAMALGLGIAAAGVVTFLMAPAMPAVTRAGTEMRAQLAAYRRTLQLTFAQAQSLDEVVATKRLAWLETPDQALVWGVALGLQADIEALLARTAALLASGQASPSTYVPGWYGWAPQPAAAAPGAVASGTAAPGASRGSAAPAAPSERAWSAASASRMFAALASIGARV